MSATIEEVRNLILKTLQNGDQKSSSSSKSKRPQKVKSVRKLVLLSLQTDEDDKNSKKVSQKAVQSLEWEEQLKLSELGSITLLQRNKQGEEDGKKGPKKTFKKEKK